MFGYYVKIFKHFRLETRYTLLFNIISLLFTRFVNIRLHSSLYSREISKVADTVF